MLLKRRAAEDYASLYLYCKLRQYPALSPFIHTRTGRASQYGPLCSNL